MEAVPIAKATGTNGEIEVFADRVRIRHATGLTALVHGLAGGQDIFISNISSVQFKNSGTFSAGYIKNPCRQGP
jgi:hypothetical protein